MGGWGRKVFDGGGGGGGGGGVPPTHSFFLFPSVFTNSGSTGTTERQQSVNTTAQTWRGVGVILWCSQTHL